MLETSNFLYFNLYIVVSNSNETKHLSKCDILTILIVEVKNTMTGLCNVKFNKSIDCGCCYMFLQWNGLSHIHTRFAQFANIVFVDDFGVVFHASGPPISRMKYKILIRVNVFT